MATLRNSKAEKRVETLSDSPPLVKPDRHYDILDDVRAKELSEPLADTPAKEKVASLGNTLSNVEAKALATFWLPPLLRRKPGHLTTH